MAHTGDVATIGITDFAVKHDRRSISIFAAWQKLTAGQPFGVVSVKAASDMYSPSPAVSIKYETADLKPLTTRRRRLVAEGQAHRRTCRPADDRRYESTGRQPLRRFVWTHFWLPIRRAGLQILHTRVSLYVERLCPNDRPEKAGKTRSRGSEARRCRGCGFRRGHVNHEQATAGDRFIPKRRGVVEHGRSTAAGNCRGTSSGC